jgi:ribosomal-protein-alanine N-acetyltransferase
MQIYRILPLTPTSARQILTWHYDPPYDLYDETPETLPGLLNPAYRYHQVLDRDGELVGYCCYGEDARVAGGDYSRGEPEVLDVGIGLRPDLTGRGLGGGFVGAILAFASQKWNPEILRVTVADFNQRSQNTFRSLGFQETHHFIRELAELPFTQLERSARMEPE